MLGSKLDNSDYDSSTTRTRILISRSNPAAKCHIRSRAHRPMDSWRMPERVSYDPFISTSAQAFPHTDLH